LAAEKKEILEERQTPGTRCRHEKLKEVLASKKETPLTYFRGDDGRIPWYRGKRGGNSYMFARPISSDGGEGGVIGVSSGPRIQSGSFEWEGGWVVTFSDVRFQRGFEERGKERSLFSP